MELSKYNFDLIIQKNALVSSEMHSFGVNIILFSVENIYFKLEVIGNSQENEKNK